MRSLLTALDEVPVACLSVGSLFIVKSVDAAGNAMIQVRTLSPQELRVLEEFPEIQRVPNQALDKLAFAVAQRSLGA
ncbi:hypothetical protein [Rugosimonospora africana]|uniref:Uncharacterized protein n=1 Tax=Rugosimonospora africana TaxID=556532 RepID=A0A8J3QTT5_9ACTN|nr:hypothetical protein [Rugosimonospora africana]GIH15680.1 hypothetical protein Raf01_38520 [Rugosimonospora africana]